MSRREFRGRVLAPRPKAAWMMSVVASATLWATGQIPPWMIAVQIAAFATSFATRAQPPDLLRNPIALNVGMLAITTITVRSALAGNPATISLAYFTALVQGLQLLDARPRRSEFILVTVALFQVILASNLTDSVFFPPLVLLFVVSVTWTLLIHTLQMEAAEAGDPAAAQQAISGDLRRMTALATTGCLVLALGLFLLLPRVKNHVLSSNLPSGLAVSGFSDTVQLGNSAGRIRKDHAVVLRVESLDGPLPNPAAAYWRGLAFDQFDGRVWSISGPSRPGERRPVSGIGRFGIELPPGPGSELQPRTSDTAHRIIREPVESGVIFASGDARRIEGPFQQLEKDLNGGLYLPRQDKERVRYTVWSRSSERSGPALHRDRTRLPFEAAAGGPQPAERYLVLPELSQPIEPIAERLVADAATDFERAWRIQEGLRLEGRYTDSPPPLGRGNTTPIEDFLHGELEGHCEYFASAMVLLARSLGMPARLVNGFAGGVHNPVGGFIEVTRADAHAWVEIHFEKAGWVRFDPTPPDQRLRAIGATSIWERVGQVGSAIELWWFQRVVDFDSADQIGGLRSLWNAWNGDAGRDTDVRPESMATHPREDEPGFARDFFERMSWTIAIIALVAAFWLSRSRRLRRENSPVPENYRRALGLLRKQGWLRDDNLSARDFAVAFAEAAPTAAARAFERITECYLAERFGGATTTDLTAEIAILESSVDRMGLGDEAHVR